MVYTPVERLGVYIWGELVGAVGVSSTGRAYDFQFDDAWLRRGLDLSPILMPLASRRRIHSFGNLPAATFGLLPPLIADALPDAFGNAVIDAAMAREGIAHSDITALDRLGYVGSRAMGALTFVPDNSPAHEATALELAELVEAARAAVSGNLSDEGDRTQSLSQLLEVGTSAGGARAKAVIAWQPQSGEVLAGNLPGTPAGFEQWLLKFDGVGADPHLGTSQGYTRTEYAYAQLAARAGIEMAETRLLEEGGRAHFVTRRFDRPGGSERLHLQTLCAMTGADFNAVGTNDYMTYFTAMRQLGIDEVEQAFRRVVFNVAASNNDDHTKNFSFLMDRSGTWRLAPAYDLTYAYSPNSRWTRQHLMSVEGEFGVIGRAHLERLGDRVGAPGYRSIIDEVVAAVAEWPAVSHEVDVPPGRRAEVEQRLAEIRSLF